MRVRGTAIPEERFHAAKKAPGLPLNIYLQQENLKRQS